MSKQTDLINIPDAITVSGSNVGIGTAAPLSKLDVSNSFITVSKGSATTGRMGSSDYIVGGTDNDFVVQSSGTGVTRFVQSSSEAMRIDAVGRVTTPYQPKIVAVGSSSATKSDYSSGEVISYWSIVSSVGISHSNGRFTVPASGTYFVTFNLYTYLENNGHEHHAFQLYKNGSVFGRDQHEVTSSMFSGTGVTHRRDRTAQATFVVDLSANDFVEVKNANAADMYLGSAHNHFSMFMLG